jgi:putative Mg2+ transporter-C (MgtC) family protein
MPDELDMAIRLVVAGVLGGIIGWQRETEQKPVGVRTLALIALGSGIFTVVSVFAFGEDQARIAAGVVAGIGFLGAGSIIRRGEGVVEGLTTAATIWSTAAMGLAIGAGMYIIGGVAAGMIVLILILSRLKI